MNYADLDHEDHIARGVTRLQSCSVCRTIYGTGKGKTGPKPRKEREYMDEESDTARKQRRAAARLQGYKAARKQRRKMEAGR